MKFSYYFDQERNHRMEMGIDIFTISQLSDNSISISFLTYIEEIKNDVTLGREEKNSSFVFSADSQSEDDHDIDFIRTRYDSQNKWIFEVKNNRNPEQTITIGLISKTAISNPLGCDIYHQGEKYEGELKANNLAQLEDTYIPPIIQQTIINETFSKEEYPNGFTSLTGNYDDVKQLLRLSDFSYTLSKPILAEANFSISFNLAPESFEAEIPPDIFSLKISGVGTITMKQNGIAYLMEGEDESSIIEKVYDEKDLPLNTIEFYNEEFTEKSKLTVNGDGQGNLFISYAGLHINAIYNHQNEIPLIEFNTMNANTGESILSKMDNIAINYRK